MATTVAHLQALITADTGKAEAAFSRLSNQAKGLPSALGGIATVAAGAFAGVAAAAVGAVTVFADFEKQISAIGAVSGASSVELGQLKDVALQLGKDTSFSAREAAQGMEELAKAGLSVEQIIGGGAKAALDLAAAGGVSVKESAEVAANAMAQFSLKASDLGNVANLVAGAANASTISVGDFRLSLSQVGAVASMAGQSFQDTATAIAVMGQQGIKGSDAGTSLKTMLLNLVPSTNAAKTAFQQLGLFAADGSNKLLDAAGNFRPLPEIAERLREGLANLTEAEGLEALQKAFGSDAVRAAAVLGKQGAEGFNEMAAAMTKVSAADIGMQRLDNLAGSLEKFKGSAETLAITVGEKLAPGFRIAVDAATAFLNSLADDQGFQQFIANVGTGFGQVIESAVAGFKKLRELFSTTGGDRAGVFASMGFTQAEAEALGAFVDAAQVKLGELADAARQVAEVVGPLIVEGLRLVKDAFIGLITEGPKVAETIGSAMTAAGSAVSTFADAIAKGDFETAFRGWGDAATTAGDRIGQGMQTAGNWFDQLSQTVAAAFDAAWQAVSGFVTKLVGDAISGITSFVSGVIGAGQQMVAAVLEWVKPFTDFMTGALTAGRIIVTYFTLEFLSALTAFLAPLTAWAVQAAQTLSEWITNAWQAATGFLSTFLGGLSAWLGNTGQTVSEQANSWVGPLSEWVNSAWSAATGFLGTFLTGLVAWLGSTAAAIQSGVQPWITAASEWVGQTWARVSTALSEFIGNIVAALVNGASRLATAAGEMAAQLVSGFVSGLQSRVGQAVGAVQSWADSVVDAAKRKYGIQSPSKVFEGIGRNVVEGFSVGVYASMPLATAAVTAVLDTVEQTAVAKATSAGQAAGAAFAAGFTDLDKLLPQGQKTKPGSPISFNTINELVKHYMGQYPSVESFSNFLSGQPYKVPGVTNLGGFVGQNAPFASLEEFVRWYVMTLMSNLAVGFVPSTGWDNPFPDRDRNSFARGGLGYAGPGGVTAQVFDAPGGEVIAPLSEFWPRLRAGVSDAMGGGFDADEMAGALARALRSQPMQLSAEISIGGRKFDDAVIDVIRRYDRRTF